MTRARLVRAALPAPFERDPMTAVERRHGVAGAPAPASGDSPPVPDSVDDGEDQPEADQPADEADQPGDDDLR